MGDTMVGDEEEIEDEIFDEIVEEDGEEISSDSALLAPDESEREFVQGSVDPEDLLSGYSTSSPAIEIDVDEDTEGDDVTDAGGDDPMTELEVDGETPSVVRGDEIELDLDEALNTGATTIRAPEGS